MATTSWYLSGQCWCTNGFPRYSICQHFVNLVSITGFTEKHLHIKVLWYSSFQEGPPDSLPPNSHLCNKCPLTLHQGWPVWPTQYWRSNGVELLRLGCRSHCCFCWFSGITLSVGSQHITRRWKKPSVRLDFSSLKKWEFTLFILCTRGSTNNNPWTK